MGDLPDDQSPIYFGTFIWIVLFHYDESLVTR